MKMRTICGTILAAAIEPYHVGKWGQLQEWSRDWDNPRDTYRHTSHLYGLYPSSQITKSATPELFEAAKTSVEHRGDRSTGWAMGWRVCLRAQGGYTVGITWMQGKIIDYKVTGGDPKGYRTVLSAK